MASLSQLLKESWSVVEDRADRVAGHFYARLFVLDPQLRDLFPIQMDAQRNRLLSAILRAVQAVDDPERFVELHQSLGRDHWTLEYAQAWRDAYDAIAEQMIAGAESQKGMPACWHAEVLSKERRYHDIAVITCRTFSHLPYHAGQYVSVETPYRPRLWRTYSIANAPRRDDVLEFHIRAVGAGWGSTALVWKVRRGDVIRLGAPMGRMQVDLTSERDVLCIAGGTGLAPLKAITEEVCRGNQIRGAGYRQVQLFFGARRASELYDTPGLEALAGRHPWLTVTQAVSEESDFPGEQGDITDVALRHGDWMDHDVYVSGSPIMVRSALSQLNQAGIPPQRVHYDAFADI